MRSVEPWTNLARSRRETVDTALRELVARHRLHRDPPGTALRGGNCLIAAPYVRTGAPLLHADADFDRLSACTPLRIFPPG